LSVNGHRAEASGEVVKRPLGGSNVAMPAGIFDEMPDLVA
jgi:hypothetical protein